MAGRSNNRSYSLVDDISDNPDPAPDKLTLSGNGNYGPRQDYADKIAAMDDQGFIREAENRVWLSAYAANNLNSDYHWQVDACYYESLRRGKLYLYQQAWRRAAATSLEMKMPRHWVNSQ